MADAWRSKSQGGEGRIVETVTRITDCITKYLFMIPLDKIALVIGRVSAVIAMILCVLWVSGSDTDEGYLGGLDAYDPKSVNVFSWHAVMMIGGIVCLSGWSLTAYRMRIFGFTTTRNLHVFFHLGAKVCLTIGVKAAWDYKDLDQDDDSPAYLVHMGSFHSMLGLATTILLVQNDMLGSIVFLVPSIPSRFRTLYKPHHMFFGKTAYIAAMLTVISGITEKQTYIGCLQTRSYRDQDVTNSYEAINDGCRIANGLGILVLLALICNIFALQRPHGRGPTNDSQGRSSTLTLDNQNLSMSYGANSSSYRESALNIDNASDYRGSI